jgi:Ca-activated chloride channel family protein
VSPIGFASPMGLLAVLALAPIAAAWAYSARRGRRVDAEYGGPPSLRIGRSAGRNVLRRTLLALAVVLLTLALARPQWGTTKAPVQRQGIDVVIALDISKSMQATDVAPSRAATAATGLTEMLRHLGGDRVGLVTFAGTAFARSPLTLDVEAIADLVGRAQRESTLVGPGTDVGAALMMALGTLNVPNPAHTRAIVLISDGEDLGGSLNDALAAVKQAGVRVYTVAAGTEQGASLPGGEAGLGPAVVSRANREALTQVAAITGGNSRDVSVLAGLAVDLSRLQQSELDREQQDVPIERFQWPLTAAALLLLAYILIADGRTALSVGRSGGSARRVAALVSLMAVATLASCASGTDVYRRVHGANAEFEQRRFTQALAGYALAKQASPDDPVIDYNIGNTLQHLQRYDDAIAASKIAALHTTDSALYTNATYSAAVAAFLRGNLAEARDGFVTVLQRAPADADARQNLEVVLRAMHAPVQPSPTPTPSGQPGGTPSGTPSPSATASRGSGGPGQPSGTPSAGQAGAGQPGAGGQPGGTGAGSGTIDPTMTEAERASNEALQRALAGLDGDITPEEALSILDAAKQASDAAGLEQRGRTAPNPNDR